MTKSYIYIKILYFKLVDLKKKALLDKKKKALKDKVQIWETERKKNLQDPKFSDLTKVHQRFYMQYKAKPNDICPDGKLHLMLRKRSKDKSPHQQLAMIFKILNILCSFVPKHLYLMDLRECSFDI